jgi:hypothetical protein
MNESLNMHKAKLEDLIAQLRREEFKVLGPVARDDSVTFDEVRPATHSARRQDP